MLDIRKARLTLGYKTQRALADALRCSESSVRNWEAGRRPGVRQLLLLERLARRKGQKELADGLRRQAKGMRDRGPYADVTEFSTSPPMWLEPVLSGLSRIEQRLSEMERLLGELAGRKLGDTP